MHRSRMLACSIALVLALPVSALAAADGDIYFGARGGMTWSSIDGGKLTTELRNRGHNVTATVDDEASAVNVYVGKHLARGFALELGFLKLGEHSVAVSGTTTATALELAQDVVDLQPKSGNAVSFIGRFEIPVIDERLYFTPRVGGFYWTSSTDVITGSGRQTLDDDGLGVAVGFGLDLALSRGLHLGLGWELLRPDQEGISHLLFAQVEYHLGQ